MITLKKRGIMYKSDARSKRPKRVNSLVPFLNEVVQIDPNFTLGDLFKLLKKDSYLYETIFSSALGHHPLAPYIQDIEKKDKFEKDDMTCIEVYWHAEQYQYEKRNEVTVHPCTHGVAFSPKTGRRKQNYAIEFTPLYELRDMPIVLNMDFVMYPCWNKTIGKKSVKPVAKGIKDFTVYDFLSAILDELSFMGDPENRDKKSKHLGEVVKEAKDKVKNGQDGDFVKFEDFLDSLNGKESPKCQDQKK